MKLDHKSSHFLPPPPLPSRSEPPVFVTFRKLARQVTPWCVGIRNISITETGKHYASSPCPTQSLLLNAAHLTAASSSSLPFFHPSVQASPHIQALRTRWPHLPGTSPWLFSFTATMCFISVLIKRYKSFSSTRAGPPPFIYSRHTNERERESPIL